jgi:hypothetical protein
MTQQTLKVITQEMLMEGCSAETIRNLWSAIKDRHRLFRYATTCNVLRRLLTLQQGSGVGQGHTFTVYLPRGGASRANLVGLTITQRRDMLMCALGTVMCMRVNEVDQLQICDVLWRFDAGFHAKYANTLACRIYKRKQDTARNLLS